MPYNSKTVLDLVKLVLGREDIKLRLKPIIRVQGYRRLRGSAVCADGERYFVKVYVFPPVPDNAERINLEAGVVARWSLHYLHELRNAEVPVPLVSEIYPLSNERFAFLCVASDEGTDLRHVLFHASPKRVLKVLIEVAVTFRRIFEQGELGMDPEPSNFTWRAKQLCYVDIFPPLISNQNVSLALIIPRPFDATMLWKRYFEPASMLRWFSLRLLEISPKLPKLFNDAIRNAFPSTLLEEIEREYRLLPASQILAQIDRRERVKRFRAIELNQLDDLYDLALRLAPVDKRSLFVPLYNPNRPNTHVERLTILEAIKNSLLTYL